MPAFLPDFRAQIGMRPMEYLHVKNCRGQAFTLQLERMYFRDWQKVGYPDLTYFGMVFRKFEGISPSEYRRLKTSHLL